jgi:hypothetical protein
MKRKFIYFKGKFMKKWFLFYTLALSSCFHQITAVGGENRLNPEESRLVVAVSTSIRNVGENILTNLLQEELQRNPHLQNAPAVHVGLLKGRLHTHLKLALRTDYSFYNDFLSAHPSYDAHKEVDQAIEEVYDTFVKQNAFLSGRER